MGGNWDTSGGPEEDSNIDEVILDTHSCNLPRVDFKMWLREETHNVLRAYNTWLGAVLNAPNSAFKFPNIWRQNIGT